MNKQITDSQYSTLVGVIARVSIEEARRLVLEKIEASLPKAGKITDARLLEAINAALASFTPGRWQGDEQGVRPDADACQRMTLAEIAAAYQRCMKLPTWFWPPKPQPRQTPKQLKEALKSISLDEAAAAYHRSLFNSDAEYEAAKRAEEKRRQAEELADATPWPLPAPPSTQTMRGSATAKDEAPTDDDLRARADRRDPPPGLPGDFMHDGDWEPGEEPEWRRRGKPASHYGEATRYARRRRLGDKIKVFFR